MKTFQPQWSGRHCIPLLLSTGLGILSIGLLPQVANACQTLNPNNPNCVPILYDLDRQRQEYNERQQGQQQKSGGIPDPVFISNGALVWWQTEEGTPGYSLALNRLHQGGAEADAIAHCYFVGGRHCRVAFLVTGGWIAIAKGEDGSLYAAESKKKDTARQQAMDRCSAASQACTVINLAKNH